ncbi:MAG: serine peptidase [Porticoccaceae bacterium]|nr:serine peptidase [Porticoccaceae bacterium]
MSYRFYSAMLVCLIPLIADARLPDFTDLVEEASSAVVKINVSFKEQDRQGLPSYRGQLPDIFRELLEQQRRSQQDRPQRYSMGSGFVISEDGFILTNHHVVNSADEIRVTFADRQEYAASIVGTDRRSDLALLKIEAENLPVLTLADDDDLRVGEWVLAIGSPFGLDYSVAAGIVSAIGRSIPTERNETYVPFIQTDVAINPGNSGGPLFDLEGRVVGINSQIYSRTGGSIGLSFAIPSSVALNVVEQLKNNGRVDRGWLGVAIQDLNQQLAQALKLSKARGALISAVENGSPADEGGIIPGDVIINFNGKTIIDSGDLPPAVGGVKPGESVPVKIFRDGSQKTLTVTVSALADSGGTRSRQDGGDRLGLVVRDTNDGANQDPMQQDGAAISQVSPGSAAEKAGLVRGDIIVQLGRVRIRDASEYQRVVRKLPENVPIPLRFFRQGRAIFRTIQISGK